MDKKARRINRIQNIAIAALSVSAFFLLWQTPLFGDLSSRTPAQLIAALSPDESVSTDTVHSDLSAFATPVRVLYSNNYARYAQDALTVLDTDFEPSGAYLRDAFSSVDSFSPSDENAFQKALEGSGLYVEFASAIPLRVLVDSLNASNAPQQDITVRRLVLCPEGDKTALYLMGQDGSCFRSAAAAESAALTAFLNECTGSSACLALHLSEEYGALSPYTMILSEQTERRILSAVNPTQEMDISEFLRLAEFNPHTENRYTESSGATVIREGNSSLRLGTDGSVTYQGGSAEDGSLYAVGAQSSGKPTAVEAIAAAQKLAVTLLQSSGGEAQLYLSDVTASAGGYSVTFDYVINGTPLRFSDGSHAASVTVEKDSITAFSLHFRSYTSGEKAVLLLPLQQAFAIAESAYENAEPSVCYIDSGTDTVSLSWVAD